MVYSQRGSFLPAAFSQVIVRFDDIMVIHQCPVSDWENGILRSMSKFSEIYVLQFLHIISLAHGQLTSVGHFFNSYVDS